MHATCHERDYQAHTSLAAVIAAASAPLHWHGLKEQQLLLHIQRQAMLTPLTIV